MCGFVCHYSFVENYGVMDETEHNSHREMKNLSFGMMSEIFWWGT